MKRFIALLILAILISGCEVAQQPSTTAKQNLTSAQAEATNAAISENDAAQSKQATQTAYNQQAARATEQADYATRQAIDSTEQARQSIAQATAQARTDAQNQLTLEQAQVAATATRAALDRQMGLDAQNAQMVSANMQSTIGAATLQAVGLHATATVVAKLQATDDDKRAREKQDDEFTFWVGWILKIGAALLVIIAGVTLLEILRKRGAVAMVGKMPVAVDGGLFGSMSVYLIEPEKPPLLLAPPPHTEQAPARDGQFLVNGERVMDEMSKDEFDDRQYWRTRCVRFLQEAVSAKGMDYGKIPTATQMKKKPEDWVETTDALGQWIIKEERKPTLCIPPYETLGKLYDAIATRKISPLPPRLRDKYAGNRGKQETGEQGVTGDNSGKQANNSTLEAITALPQKGEPTA